MRHSAVNEQSVTGHLAAGEPAGNGISRVVFQTAEGPEVSGQLLRLSRHSATFELLQTEATLRTSEVLNGFKILVGGRTIYFGRAVVSGVVHTGGTLAGEVKLSAPDGESAFFLPGGQLSLDAQKAYVEFFQGWQREYRIAPEFKVLVTDIAAYLSGVRQWLESLEFSLPDKRDPQNAEAEAELLTQLAQRIIPAFNAQHERFEDLAKQVPPELTGAHQEFVRRHWQRLFLGSPFGHRTFHKPLGFAGDYEMMDMIHRNRPEGNSLYEKLIHLLLLDQWPAWSVRNRIAHLKSHLVTETARVARGRGRARVLNVGCGPARELQEFVRESSLSHELDCTLLDFNRETLDFAWARLESERQRFARRTRVSTVNLSVNQLLRQAVKQGHLGLDGDFDYIYCAGLFDYLSESTCAELVKLFYNNLRPGGLMEVANMNDKKPFRNFIEFVLDWQLIYRDKEQIERFAPQHLRHLAAVVAEPPKMNIVREAADNRHGSPNMFLQIRRPD